MGLFAIILKIIIIVFGVILGIWSMAAISAAVALAKDTTSKIGVILAALGWVMLGICIAGL